MDKLFLVPKKRSLTTKNSVNIETFAADLISRIDQASAQIIKTLYGKEKSLWVIGIRMYTLSSADFMVMEIAPQRKEGKRRERAYLVGDHRR